MLHTKYQGSRPTSGFREFVYVLTIQAYVKHVTLRGGAIFGPRGIICTNLVEVY